MLCAVSAMLIGSGIIVKKPGILPEMRPKKKTEMLTEVELEFMSKLWELGEGTVRDVLDMLAEGRKLAYTSAATILRILEQKQFVTSTKQGKTFTYRPALSKDSYQSRSLRNLSEKLFDNTPVSLVARLVDDNDLSEEALDEIRALLDRRLRNGKS
jgi:predicted transcriptional regulator